MGNQPTNHHHEIVIIIGFIWCNRHAHGDELEYHHDDEASWRCFQTWTLWVQYHNYCPSGAVNETLFHDYLDHCPMCFQVHYELEGAPDCQEDLNCTDTDAQVAAVTYVDQNCITADGCSQDCQDSWQDVESYHRLCDNDELAEEFDSLFDGLAWEETDCTEEQVHCNVHAEEDYAAECSSELNEEWAGHLADFGIFNVDEEILGVSGADSMFVVTLTGMVCSVLAVLKM